MPLMPATHECELGCLERGITVKRLCIIAMKAMKQMTGYFSGYISKRQPVGRFQLRTALRALPYLQNKLRQMPRASQLAQMVSRMFAVLEGRGKLRTASEEFNLAATSKDYDELKAEFTSTFATVTFSGYRHHQQI